MWLLKDKKGGSTSFTAKALSDFLIRKILDKEPKLEQQEIINEFILKLKDNLSDTTIRAIFETAFHLGYTYRLFMEKNDVSYKNDTSDDKGQNDGPQ